VERERELREGLFGSIMLMWDREREVERGREREREVLQQPARGGTVWINYANVG